MAEGTDPHRLCKPHSARLCLRKAGSREEYQREGKRDYGEGKRQQANAIEGDDTSTAVQGGADGPLDEETA